MMNQAAFPLIENLSDVLPHIEGREEFIVSRKDEYTIVCYVVGLQSTFELDESDPVGSMIRRECRGLAFSNVTGELISRPYHKFFNVGEREETYLQNLDVSVPHVILEKLDGSMIRPIYLEGEKRWRLGTKMGVTEVAMNAEAWIADKVRFMNLIEECRLVNFTPIFEWCSRQNRIVVDYPEEGLILTALRSNRSGFYLGHADMMAFALANNLRPNEVVKIIQSGSINQQSLEQIKAWDDGEGVVIRFEGLGASRGHMVKVKADNYVLLHKSKDAISQEKNVIDVIVNDKVDDLLPILSDKDRETLISFQEKFWSMVEVVSEFLENDYNEGRHISDQKTFAGEFVSSRPKKFHGFLYHAHKGGDIKDLLIKKISSSLSSRTKVNEARWMWGGLVWNEAG